MHFFCVWCYISVTSQKPGFEKDWRFTIAIFLSGWRQVSPKAVKLQKTLTESRWQPWLGSIQYSPKKANLETITNKKHLIFEEMLFFTFVSDKTIYILTVFVVRLNHHELFAGPGRAFKCPQRFSHEFHIILHGREGSKDLFHSLYVFQRLISLEEFLRVETDILPCQRGCSSCLIWVPSSFPSPFVNWQWLNKCCRGSLMVGKNGLKKSGEREWKRMKSANPGVDHPKYLLGVLEDQQALDLLWDQQSPGIKTTRDWVDSLHPGNLSHLLSKSWIYPGRYCMAAAYRIFQLCASVLSGQSRDTLTVRIQVSFLSTISHTPDSNPIKKL